MSHIVESGKSDFVKVNVSNSHNDAVAFEVKFAKDLTVAQLKVGVSMDQYTHVHNYINISFYRASWRY